jgi:secretion/DNA translocation related TadE-like protein
VKAGVVRSRLQEVTAGDPEGGSATIWVLGCTAVLACAGLFVGAAGLVAVSRHRTATVADLAALAGAQSAARGTDACATAAAVARAQRAWLAQCADAPTGVVDVLVEQEPVGFLVGLGTVRISARAGPARVP